MASQHVYTPKIADFCRKQFILVSKRKRILRLTFLYFYAKFDFLTELELLAIQDLEKKSKI